MTPRPATPRLPLTLLLLALAVGCASKPAPLPADAAALPTTKPAPLPPGGGPPGGVATPPAPPQLGVDRSAPPQVQPQSSGEPAGRVVSTGSGFVVAPGRVLTNAHVVADCTSLGLRLGPTGELAAQVVARDAGRDLALLSVPGDPGPPLRFRAGPAVRRGEGVVTYGFPLSGLLSSGPTLTTGEVSALSGIADDPRQFQISAPVQPGNSGGPLLDQSGRVIGVVVAKLNAQRVARATGDIPQNVNFAVKAEPVLDFLREAAVRPALAGADAAPRATADIGELVHPSTLLVRCRR